MVPPPDAGRASRLLHALGGEQHVLQQRWSGGETAATTPNALVWTNTIQQYDESKVSRGGTRRSLIDVLENLARRKKTKTRPGADAWFGSFFSAVYTPDVRSFSYVG